MGLQRSQTGLVPVLHIGHAFIHILYLLLGTSLGISLPVGRQLLDDLVHLLAHNGVQLTEPVPVGIRGLKRNLVQQILVHILIEIILIPDFRSLTVLPAAALSLFRAAFLASGISAAP